MVGEWTPIRFFKNIGASFVEVSEQLGTKDLIGWWSSVEAVDIDFDGDTDYVVGNLGLNYKFKASAEKPFHLYAADFDKNRSIHIVLAKYDGDRQVPVRGLECTSEQMPFISTKFTSYHDFADASVEDLIGMEIDNAIHFKATTFESIILKKDGNSFSPIALPVTCQFAPINAIVLIMDDKKQLKQLLTAGNMFGSEPETSRADASFGTLLNISNTIETLLMTQSGISLPYDVKDIKAIKIDDGIGILVVSNDDELRILTHNRDK